MSESVSNLAIKTYHALKKLSAPHKYKTALVQQQAVFDCEIFVKKVARPKHCKARPTIQRIQDLQSGWYLLGLERRWCEPVGVVRPLPLPHPGAGRGHLGQGEAVQWRAEAQVWDVRHGRRQQLLPGHPPGAGGPGEGQQVQGPGASLSHPGDTRDSGDRSKLGRSTGRFIGLPHFKL